MYSPSLGAYMTTNKVQVNRYMKFRHEGKSQQEASARVGISERTAREIDGGKHSSQKIKMSRTHRTRKNPLEDIWDSVLVPMLEEQPKLAPIILFEYIQDRYPGKYDHVYRTLQRHVKEWKTLNRDHMEVMFNQDHIAGAQAL